MREFKKMSGDFRDFEDIKCLIATDGPNKNTPLDEETGRKYGTFENGIGERLKTRGKLLDDRRKIVDVQVSMALIGFIIMLVENEFFYEGFITKLSTISIVLKSFVSLSTAILLIAVVLYYVTEIKMRMIDNQLDDWRLLVAFPNTNLKLFLELLICIIHPLPFNVTIPVNGPDGDIVYVSIDPVLSILMIFRVYLLGRVAVVHNKLLSGTATRSLSAFNRVDIDGVFVFKALMTSSPGSVLITIMIFILLANSWAMRNCETFYQFERENSNFWNSMWIISITFLTVGYGDTYPVSVCGRCVSVTTGLMGIGTTALLITVILQKLEQTRAEKYVYSFVKKAHLDNGRKMAAADVIKNWLQLCNLRRHYSVITSKQIRVHRKLQHAVYTMREARNKRDSIGESTIGLIEISKAISDVEQRTESLQTAIKEIKPELAHMQRTTRDLQLKINDIYKVLITNDSKRQDR